MGRRSKPWYWRARKRWAATVNGLRVVAPATIGPRDEHEAWEWHRSVCDRETPEPGEGGSVAGICELYLEWDESRVTAGERDARAHRSAGSKLTRICGTAVRGGKVGDMQARALNRGHLEELTRAWAHEGLSPGYMVELARVLKAVCSWAARPRGDLPPLLPASPLAGAPSPPAPVPSEKFASRSEAAAWLRWLWRDGQRDYAHLQRTLIHSGARPSELTGATRAHVRWEGSGAVITLTRWKASRKTGRSRRVFLVAKLRRSLARRMAKSGDPGDLIWTSATGRRWSASSLSSHTLRQRGRAIAAGVPITAEGPDRLTCYRWRHTAASSLLMAGVPIATVAELLGTSVGMIARVYGHLLGGHLRAAAEAIGRKG